MTKISLIVGSPRKNKSCNFLIDQAIEGIKAISDDQSDKSFENKVLDLLSKQNQSSSGEVNVADLTKMIAVAQKPELIDKKVN